MTRKSERARRAVEPEDLLRIAVVSDPHVSPDGGLVSWVQTRADSDDDIYRSAIWLSSVDGGDARQLTGGAHRDQAPRWSPDGTQIAFSSNRPSTLPEEPENDLKQQTGSPDRPLTQIWTIRIDGGEAIQRTHHRGGATGHCWSPDGGMLAFVGADEPGDDEPAPPTSTGPVADERVVRRISYRADGKGYLEQYTHIWTVDLASGEHLRLTSSDVFDREPAWSPDGTQIAFSSNRSGDREREWNRSSIHLVPATGGEVTTVAPDDARFTSPAWSPSGERLAFLGHLGTDFATNVHVWTVRPDAQDLVDHTARIDLNFGDSGTADMHYGSNEGPLWIDSCSILALASTSGETQVYEVETTVNSARARTSGKHRIAGIAGTGTGLLVIRGMINRPFELERWNNTKPPTPISTANDAWLQDVELRDAIQLDVTSGDGTPIDVWLIPPAGLDPTLGTKHPLILQIHGGPHSMYGYGMFHEMQLMAAKGYAVVFSNPRGSAGYGEEFMSCTRGIWGEADMPDVIAAVDAATALDWIDAGRLGITGGSYGGYLTNWIIGHDQRFKAAVTQRCVSNFHSFVGTSDIGTTFGVCEFDGLPWRNAEKLLHHSPISYVDDMMTPLLILHSDQDLRCPIEQAEQLFASLKYLDREVAFVRIPEEGHELSRSGKPGRRMARLHHLIGWFDQHL